MDPEPIRDDRPNGPGVYVIVSLIVTGIVTLLLAGLAFGGLISPWWILAPFAIYAVLNFLLIAALLLWGWAILAKSD
jgi:predicted lipid-binding transport protein (Tim44 family)